MKKCNAGEEDEHEVVETGGTEASPLICVWIKPFLPAGKTGFRWRGALK